MRPQNKSRNNIFLKHGMQGYGTFQIKKSTDSMNQRESTQIPGKENARPLSLCFKRTLLTFPSGRGTYILFTCSVFHIKLSHKS